MAACAGCVALFVAGGFGVGGVVYRGQGPAFGRGGFGWGEDRSQQDLEWVWARREFGFDYALIPRDFGGGEFVLPLWMPFVVFAAIAYRLRPGAIALPGHCRKCGYDLTGNISGRCPECGESV